MGDILIEMNSKAAPNTVKNFIQYVESGFYDGVIFHRVIPDFMIQTGGFTEQMVQKQPRGPIRRGIYSPRWEPIHRRQSIWAYREVQPPYPLQTEPR